MEQRAINENPRKRNKVKVVKVIGPEDHIRKQNEIKRKVLRKIQFSVMGGLSIIMLFALLSKYSYLANLSNQAFALDKEIKTLEAERDFLITEIEPYKATDRIESLAKIKLDMDYPRTDQYVSINSNSQDYMYAEEKTAEKTYGFLTSILNLFR